MIGYESFFQAQLTAGIDETATNIPLDNVPTPSEGFLVIEPLVPSKREIIYYTSKDGSSVTVPAGVGNGRGYDGTTASSHLQNADVIMAPVGKMFSTLQDGTAIAPGAVTPEKILAGTGTTWVWQNWTPTIIGITVGNGVLNYAKYIIIGKTCFFRIKFTFGSTTAGAGAFGFSLPATAALVGGGNPHEQIGRVGLNDATGSNFTGYCRLETGSDTNAGLNVVRTDATWATSGSVNTGQPFSWAVNDSWSVDGYYEAA
jgi:hypothetical protein